MTNEELFDKLVQHVSSLQYIKVNQIPHIDLYMDQVTTFMDTYLADTRRCQEDKVLTKTMINNYAKNNLLPSPVKKKYSENHILQLILIYYMKSFLSISDIETILTPLTQYFWNENSNPSFAQVYEKMFSYSTEGIDRIREDLQRKFALSQDALHAEDPEQDEYLELFSFLCMIVYDIYLKKQVITGVVDELKQRQSEKSKEKDKKGKKTS